MKHEDRLTVAGEEGSLVQLGGRLRDLSSVSMCREADVFQQAYNVKCAPYQGVEDPSTSVLASISKH